ncbi:DUF7260 family protein [Halobaculum sp. D14]|uniref:DUF7260 family protein n=1 Tax=unclassified Halobaculum TaxID=2640896 RepID=UPI003EBE537E
MSVETHVQQALDRVRREQDHVADKTEAYESFERTVRETPCRSPTGGPRPGNASATDGFTAATATAAGGPGRAEDRCEAVREAFAETVRPCSTADVDDPEPLVETMRSELGAELAATLAPHTAGQFTAETKRAVRAASADRRAELSVMDAALAAETDALRDAETVVADVADWLVDAEETPLSALGFDALRDRHERLAAHRNRCEGALCDRQSFLAAATNRGAGTGISHRALASYLYADLPVEFPVLATCTRLLDVCLDAQRAVRAHLVRRV